MNPKTRDALEARRCREDAETLEQQMARILAKFATAPAQPTIPTAERTPLVTCTLNELHDLIYNGAAEYLHSLTQMGADRARMHSTRIADNVVRAVQHTDYVHEGRDPRA